VGLKLLTGLLLTLTFWSCSPKVYEKGKVETRKCPRVIYTRVYYCSGKYAYTDRLQHMSRVRIVNPRNGKKITIAVRYRKGVKGVCLPRKYRRFLGKPFTGRVYVLRCGENNVRRCPRKFRGYASWYGKEFAGRKTASGVIFSPWKMYAAHRYLPFGTLLEVKNLKNGRKVIVEVVDRGPFVRGRHLDLSYAAAKKLGMIKEGVIPFEARVIRCGK